MKHIYPVIHHLSEALTMEQAAVAKQAGAKTVFLISHHNEDMDLIPLAKKIINSLNIDVGLNLLNTGLFDALDLCKTFNIKKLWTDNAGFHSTYSSMATIELLDAQLETYSEEGFDLELFAGVAFKYQRFDSDPGAAAKMAIAHRCIPVTSGVATGVSSDIEKLRAINNAVGSRFGVASGVTLDNVIQTLKLLDYVFVATGVSLDEHRFDPEKLKKLFELASELN